MAYNTGGVIEFEDIPEYPEYPEDNTYEANRMAYENDIWDGLATEDLLNLDLPF